VVHAITVVLFGVVLVGEALIAEAMSGPGAG
jgi:hypothetical protein